MATLESRLRQRLEALDLEYEEVMAEMRQPRPPEMDWYAYEQETDRLFAESERIEGQRQDVRLLIRRAVIMSRESS